MNKRICLNCNQFLPSNMEEPTEYGICLNDEDFEPFIEELLEKSNYASCQGLINSKKFLNDQEACGNFEKAESIEIDDESSLGQELRRLAENGELNADTLQDALLEDKLSNIDWNTMPVDEYAKQLESCKKKEQKDGISCLGGLIAQGNKEAFKELLKFFKKLPPPKRLDEVYFKMEVLRLLKGNDAKSKILPCLIDDLYKTPSNNTTRQWISEIFRVLEYSPKDEIREPLEKMLKDKRFSYRLKKKMKTILYDNYTILKKYKIVRIKM